MLRIKNAKNRIICRISAYNSMMSVFERYFHVHHGQKINKEGNQNNK
jgi:hypothetical protein